MNRVLHLVRRWRRSLSRRPPAAVDEQWALGHLLPTEQVIWLRMEVADRRHSIEVARRFERLSNCPQREHLAAALLHDVGKVESGLGTTMRVVATVVGPVTDRFRQYHHHEALGMALAAAAGSAPATLELLAGRGPFGAALRDADNI